uniref:Uncharacterized protein n=1 Tax=Arundo donax TaxID=35708 RepID=A0A0A9DM19_ARUDO
MGLTICFPSVTVLVTSSGPTGGALHHETSSCLDLAGEDTGSGQSLVGARWRSSVL